MKLSKVKVGQRVFVANLIVSGRSVDNGCGDCFTSKEEAEADGREMVGGYDPEWQKRYPGEVDFVVREYEIDSVDDDGITWGGFTV